MIVKSRMQFVPQSEVECQPWRCLPVVLRIERVCGIVSVNRVLRDRIEVSLVRNTQQERRVGITDISVFPSQGAGDGPREGVLTEFESVINVLAVENQVAIVGAELQRVSALDPSQVVDDLVGTVSRCGGIRIAAGAGRLEARDVEPWYGATGRIRLRQILQANLAHVLRGGASADGHPEMISVEAATYLVNDGGFDDPVKSDRISKVPFRR